MPTFTRNVADTAEARASNLWTEMPTNDFPGYTQYQDYKVKRAWVYDPATGLTKPCHRERMPLPSSSGGPPEFAHNEANRVGDTMYFELRPVSGGTYTYTRTGFSIYDTTAAAAVTSYTISGSTLSFDTIRQHIYTLDRTDQTTGDSSTETEFQAHQMTSATRAAAQKSYQDPRPEI